MKPKRIIQGAIRAVHKFALSRQLPDQLGIYFHALSPEDHPKFKQVVEYFIEQGYAAVGPTGFFESSGRRLFLSFDDNFRSWHDLLPLLDELDVVATFYTNSGVFQDASTAEERRAYFDRLNYHGERITLTTSQLREIRAAGNVIGAHTHRHFDLGALPVDQAKKEIITSKKALEDVLGEEVSDFSFPFGMRRNFSEELRTFCLASGFQTVADATPGMQYAGQRKQQIHRSVWHFEKDFDYNLQNVLIDGSMFEKRTGRSAVG